MNEEGELALNIYSSSQRSGSMQQNEYKRKRSREKKNVKLKGTSEDAKGYVRRSDTQQIKAKREKVQPKQRSRDDDANAGGSKFSSLFKNNPEIPQIESVVVNGPKEEIFSGESFSRLDLHHHMIANLEQRLGVKELTAVQKASIPHVLAGNDVMIKSQTGSGKTLCYAVPVVEKLHSLRPHIERAHGPYALIILPTRELALQTLDTIQKLLQPFQWVVPGCMMGGERKKAEKARLRKGINVLVGTPGRLYDHLQNTRSLQVQHLRFVVLDEADRLLDMGFEKEVRQILSILNDKCSSDRQTILLSATLSQGVERLAGMSLKNPVRIHITDTAHNKEVTSCGTETFATPESLKHYLVVVPSKLRLVTLAAFILWKTKYTNKNKKMVVFLATQDSVEFHHRLLESGVCSQHDSWQLFKLHGDMPQKERTKVFKDFCDVDSGVLLCTDVAARGLDLPHVRWIVQYNTPGSATDYIHRVGRTARIGSQGHALLFLTPAEIQYVKVLQEYKISLNELQMDDILKTLLIEAHNQPQQFTKAAAHTVQESATQLQRTLEDMVRDDKALSALARKAYQSFVRSYATYSSDLKRIFHVKTLHLGHVAKSFALKDTPTHISEFISRTAPTGGSGLKRKRDHLESIETQAKKPRIHTVSEFASGLEGVKKAKTKTVKLNPTTQRTRIEKQKKFAGKGTVKKFTKKSLKSKGTNR